MQLYYSYVNTGRSLHFNQILCSGRSLHNDDNVTSIQSHEQLHQNLQPGKYVACLYHSVWYIGAVIERSDQNKDAYIKFMKQNHLVLTWPQELQNECWVPFTDILTTIAPVNYKDTAEETMLAATEYDNILELFAARQNS